MAIAGLLAGVAKSALAVAKDKAKSFITGKKKTVKPGAIKKVVVEKKKHLAKKVVH